MMIKIDKFKTECGYDFQIVTNEGCFRILFAGNLDLYWVCYCKKSILDSDNEKVFYITKENYYLFSLFEKLYDEINGFLGYLWKDYCVSEDDYECCNYMYEYLRYQDSRSFNDKIEWYSDDFDKKEASVLKIEKLDECYKVIFEKSKNKEYLTYAIRFRNHGSRYFPYNLAFMNMYNTLCSYDPDFHQIHVEEYLYQKRLVKSNKS